MRLHNDVFFGLVGGKPITIVPVEKERGKINISIQRIRE